MRKLRGALDAFRNGYGVHMAYPRKSRRAAIGVGLAYARNYLHNTSRRWPGCSCEMHRKDSHRFNHLDRTG